MHLHLAQSLVVKVARLAMIEGKVLPRPNITTYLESQCTAYAEDHAWLLAGALRPSLEAGTQSAEALYNSVHRSWEGGDFKPVVFLSNASLILDPTLAAAKLQGMRMAAIPFYTEVLAEAATEFELPVMFLPLNMADEPASTQFGWPSMFGFCNQPHTARDIHMLYGSQWPDTEHIRLPRAGPSDNRQGKAVWLGSANGWGVNPRRAVCLASQQHPDTVYAGLNKEDHSRHGVTAEEQALFRKPYMSLRQQVDSFKYVVNVAGHCASGRLKMQLASDAAVMWVQSPDREWYYSFLVPFVHYIPITLRLDGSIDLHEQVIWAERNPELVGKIVQNANDFARHHLSRQAHLCYLARLLVAYSEQLVDMESFSKDLLQSWS